MNSTEAIAKLRLAATYAEDGALLTAAAYAIEAAQYLLADLDARRGPETPTTNPQARARERKATKK
jgi:hypothetical protein